MDEKQIIVDFIEDRINIETFMDYAGKDGRIYAYLQAIVDHIVKNKLPTRRRNFFSSLLRMTSHGRASIATPRAARL